MAGILDQVKDQVDKMGPDDVKAELQKLLEQGAKRKAVQAKRNSDPEVIAKRTEYSKSYREKVMADPEKAAVIIERRKAYHSKPETKAKMKAYRETRNARVKAILAKAKELGIEVPTGEAAAQ